MALLHRPDNSAPDPDGLLIGTCATCKTPLELKRGAAMRSAQDRHDTTEVGTWGDLPFGACPKCGARVYLRAKLPPLPPPEDCRPLVTKR